jgi:predicted DNA-binding protein
MSKNDVRKNFVFKKEVVEHLEELAKKEEKSMTMIIQELIEEKYQEVSKEEKLEAFYAFAGSGNGLFKDMTIQSIKAMKGDKGEKYGG